MTVMVSFRAEDEEVERVDEWAKRLGIDRTTLLRDAIAAYVARLAAEHDAAAYEAQPLTHDELALMAAESWGPADDWSDLASWLDARDAKG